MARAIRGRRGGGTVNRLGYRVIGVDGKKVLEHRYVYEQATGITLPSGTHIHHRDGNKLNNAIDNLEVVTPAEHYGKHATTFRSESHKQCTVCLAIKPRSGFTPRKRDKGDPHDSRCRECARKAIAAIRKGDRVEKRIDRRTLRGTPTHYVPDDAPNPT